MYITVEISYYPLTETYNVAVNDFLDQLNDSSSCDIQTGVMSTTISGHYDEIMALLTASMLPLMKKYASVFNLKIANACDIGK